MTRHMALVKIFVDCFEATVAREHDNPLRIGMLFPEVLFVRR